MIRPLLMIAAVGFVAMVASFAAASAFEPFRWNGMGWFKPSVDGGGPMTTRQIPWSGGSRLIFNVPDDVDYTQGPEAKITVAGPKGAVDHLAMNGDALEFDAPVHAPGRLKVTVSAPGVSTFVVNGSGDLKIAGYSQDQLDVRLHGSGDVVARGQARRVAVEIAGSADADLSGVAARQASVKIAGSGDTRIAPSDSAEVSIAGSGDVTLTTHPRTVNTNIAGSGRIIQADPAAPPKS